MLLPAGRTVTRLQTVDGTDFMYHPPPRQKMPSAATIAGAPINRCAQPVGSLPEEWACAHRFHGSRKAMGTRLLSLRHREWPDALICALTREDRHQHSICRNLRHGLT